MCKPSLISIDGPAGSGKSTIGKMLADHLGYLYFDTGVMYRAVTWGALERNLSIEDEAVIGRLAEQLDIDVRPVIGEEDSGYEVILDGEEITREIRQPEVDAWVSVIASYPQVRQALSQQQRRVGLRGRVVMVGRDIGTVVLPEADLKIYLDASLEERASRRFRELVAGGQKTRYEEVLASMRNRDEIDSTREVAPLRAAHDAAIIDTDGLSIEQVFKTVLVLVEERCQKGQNGFLQLKKGTNKH
jgi:CMP/dCMP kinase